MAKETPGTIIGVDKKGIHVACGTDKLILEEVSAGRQEADGGGCFSSRLPGNRGDYAERS